MRRVAVLSVFVVCASLLVGLLPTFAPLLAGDLWAWMQADPERALLAVVSGAAWLLAAWLLVVTGLSLLSRAGGCTGRLAGRLARVITPLALRRVLEASLGVALAVGPAGAAVAGPTQASPVSTVGVVLNDLTPPPAPIVAPAELRVPDLDRPTAGVTAQPSAPPTSTAPKPAPPTAAAPKAAPPTLAAPASPSPSPAVSAPPPSSVKTHTVLAGDTLWAIAAAELEPSATAFEITVAWQRWYQENRSLIGSDPALIIPGQLLVDHQPSR